MEASLITYFHLNNTRETSKLVNKNRNFNVLFFPFHLFCNSGKNTSMEASSSKTPLEQKETVHFRPVEETLDLVFKILEIILMQQQNKKHIMKMN
ncbi:unnamed protein product [Xylocopa violacea]|uniref:Uncharacterized protein n=1 Tax=Xylocopa violacea TaxID=135666 RepID=A0ABP1NNG4_XYLVO